MAIPNKKRVETSILCIIVATVTLTANFHIFRRSLVLVPINNRIIHQRSSSKSPSLPSSKIATITIPPNTMPGRSYEEYIKDDYKAFIFAIHPEHGMLLLHCTRKKKKPPHFQVPGGHVDAEDFEHASSTVKDHGTNILLQACKIGAARELFEETGIDVRSALARLQPVRLRDVSKDEEMNEMKNRLFFKVCLDDSDFVTSVDKPPLLGLTKPLNSEPSHLMVKLSHEHQGFTFESDAKKSIHLLEWHSGGKVSSALQIAIDRSEVMGVTKRDAEDTNQCLSTGN